MVMRTQYHITIPDLLSAGEGSEQAEMTVRRMGLEERWEFDDVRFSGPDDQGNRDEFKAYVRALAGQLEKYLVEWNLAEEDGAAIPATAAGFLSLEDEMIQSVITAWVDVVIGISGPLGESSTGAPSFPEELIPMEAPSTHPENSAVLVAP